ncbi:MAG: M23 family metallopeptidase [Alistipes sp.]|nr:M23 family metallopeptidase [Alistipes sp.]MDE5906572.1 M23 family metallopeptidase [Alistipes sp.]
MPDKKEFEKYRRHKRRRQNIIRATIHLFVWMGAAVLYYMGFSIFFDTPTEYLLRHSTDALRDEYAVLSQRYDSLEVVLGNLEARDRSVFHTLFESEPYEYGAETGSHRGTTYEELVSHTTPQLRRSLRQRTLEMEARLESLNGTYRTLQSLIDSIGPGRNSIPAIQPVINKQLALLTASYGMRIHPFYKTLQSHQGVDYTVPEGSRVFATADGVVRDVLSRNSTSGRTVTIDHGNGFETSYSHLSQIDVRKGQRVSRGDIIARSGDTGLSLAPHLHYEVRYNGMRIDPIHYFFMELSPSEYQRLMRIAQSGMQSFD